MEGFNQRLCKGDLMSDSWPNDWDGGPGVRRLQLADRMTYIDGDVAFTLITDECGSSALRSPVWNDLRNRHGY
jgi:hypothetical protein